ncbi:MAG TPA: amidohydrolase family protein [Thermoanaerobaculia bacterium]|nr:amidohydrolase family protein [Thermoanaerobaculia bacterium]
MKPVKRAVAVLLVLAGLLAAVFAGGVLWPEPRLQPVRTAGAFAIVDAGVIDVRAGTVLPRQTVVVEGNRIRSVRGDGAAALPPSLRRIDGRGKYLLPALWDMHTHVFAVSPLLDLPLYIAYGVTNVRDMQGCPQPDDPFVACPEEKRRWTAEAVAGERVGPRIVASASWMANGPGMVRRLGDVPPYFDTATPEQARRFVRHFAGRVEAIKIYDRIPRDAYLALAAEARRLQIDVVGHRPWSVSAVEAAAHQKSLEHARFILHESFAGSAELRARGAGEWREDRRRMLDEHDPRMAEAIFEAMKENGTWYVPTHLTRWSDAYADDPSVRHDSLLRYLHPLMKRQWLEDVDELLAGDPSPEGRETYRRFYRKGLELTGAAHRAGVKVLAGTDYIVAGADLHRELRHLRAAGLSPADVLRSATLFPAQYFQLDGEYGTVEEGKVADLLLLGGNPLDDIRNTERIEAVIFNGNFHDRASLDEIERFVERRARSWTVACKIVWRFVKNPGGY